MHIKYCLPSVSLVLVRYRFLKGMIIRFWYHSTMDLRSQAMRSKLLSLYLISTLLSSHSYAFLAPANGLMKELKLGESGLFIDVCKQILCLSVTHNATSVVPHIIDLSFEIFGKLLLNLRETLKVQLQALIFRKKYLLCLLKWSYVW